MSDAHLKLVTSNAFQRDPISASSVGDPAAGRHDAAILVTSPIRSQAWIAQGIRNRDERVAPFIEHEFDPADVAVKELIRGWSIPLVRQLEAAGRTGPGHDDSRPAQSAPIRVTNVPAMFTRRAEIGLQKVALRGQNRVSRLTSWADRVRQRCGRLRAHIAVSCKHEKSVCAKQDTFAQFLSTHLLSTHRSERSKLCGRVLPHGSSSGRSSFKRFTFQRPFTRPCLALTSSRRRGMLPSNLRRLVASA